MPPIKRNLEDKRYQEWMNRICDVPLSIWKHVSLQYDEMSDHVCWIWSGSKDVNGYAKMRYNKKLVQVRNFLYEKIENDIPINRRIKHRCKNKHCINPYHMKCIVT